MSNINVLIWDDQPREASKMKNLLTPKIQKYGWPLSVSTRSEPYPEFQDFLEKNHHTYDLLILDCMEGTGPDNFPVAEQALRMLNEMNANIKVIVTSIYQPENFYQLPAFYDSKKCRAILKMTFQSIDQPDRFDLVIPAMLNLPSSNTNHSDKISLKIEDDIYTNYLVATLGGISIIKQILVAIQEHLNADIYNNKFVLKKLAQGLSGAIVFRLVIIDKKGDETFRFIKIARDEELLVTELLKVKVEYKKFAPNYTISYLTSQPVAFKGFFVLVAELVIDSNTFRKILLNNDGDGKSLEILNELMSKCLKKLYQTKRISNSTEQISYSILKAFDPRRLAFLSMAVDELKEITGNITVIDKIQKWIINDGENSAFKTRDNLKNIQIHGDLHSNNVIVNDDDKLFIIDPANMTIGHWSRDICMLIVDIFTIGIDVGTKENFGLDKIRYWEKLGTHIIVNREINDGRQKKSVLDAINLLCNVEYLRSIFGNRFEPWEFKLSLGVEFLKASYKYNILPPGKRAVCLLLGQKALRFAEREFERRKIY